MNVDISETIEDREMGSQIYIEKWDLRFKSRSLVRSASMLRENGTATLPPTNRPNLWWHNFYAI